MGRDGDPIRVLHIVTRMNTGGVAVLITNLMRGLGSQQIEARLLAGSCDISEEDYLEKIANDIIFVKIPSLQRSISPKNDFIAFLQIAKEIRKFKPDIVHTHTSKAGLLGRIASIVFSPKSKRIHTFHGHLLDGYFSTLKTNFLVKTESLLARKTDKLIAMGHQVKKDLLQVGVGREEQFVVFLPGLRGPKIVQKELARKQLELDLEGTYCLFVGRLTQIKRPDRLLDTIAELKKRSVNIKFIIAGEGDLKEMVNARISKDGLDVKMLGWQNDPSLAFSSADILILCSDNEAVSLVLIEGSQYSLPLVSTNVGAVGDVLIDNSTGYLTNSSPTTLADAIEKLVRDPQLRKMMGEAGKARASQYFSLERMLKDHADLYRSL